MIATLWLARDHDSGGTLKVFGGEPVWLAYPHGGGVWTMPEKYRQIRLDPTLYPTLPRGQKRRVELRMQEAR